MAKEIVTFGIKYKLDEKNFTAEVIGTTMTNCSLRIPDAVASNGVYYTVTSIGRNAFKDININSVTIPNTVEIIKNRAFYGSKIEQVCIIPHAHRIDIWDCAFANCRHLKSVQFAGPVYFFAKRTFMNCEALEMMDTENIVLEILYGSFHGCSKLKEFRFSDGIDIEDMAFVNVCFDEITILGQINNFVNLLSALSDDTTIHCNVNTSSDVLDLAFEGYDVVIQSE